MTPSRAAIHEAGHAVLCAYFGFKISVVRLFAPGGAALGDQFRTAGYVLPSERLGEVDPARWVCVLLAARAAERELCTGLHSAQRDEMAARDLEHATEWLEALDPEHAARDFKRADALARALVITHASLIRALAVELDTRRSMTGTELDAFLWAHAELEERQP